MKPYLKAYQISEICKKQRNKIAVLALLILINLSVLVVEVHAQKSVPHILKTKAQEDSM